MPNEPTFDADDQALVARFQSAWQRTIEAAAARALDAGTSAPDLVAREREEARLAILRAKTPDALVQWFLRFLADAGPRSGPTMSGDTGRLRKVILDPARFEHVRSVMLFALLSYEATRSESSEPRIFRPAAR